MNISNKNIEDFFIKGFFILPDIFSKNEIEALSKGFDHLRSLTENKMDSFAIDDSKFILNKGTIQRVIWACNIIKEFNKISVDPRITTPVATLLNSKKIIQIICQTHFKLPGDGVSFSWHQDCENRKYGTEYWRDLNGMGSYVQTVLAIDDMNYENGPLKFVLNSTRYSCIGLRKGKDFRPFFDSENIHTLLMKKGSLAIFHPSVIHGSDPNNSKTPRRVLINGYCYPGSNYFKYPGSGLGQTIDSSTHL